MFCRPIGSYAMGVMSINQKSLQQVNIIQNNLMRYSLGIPYKTHIKNIMKAMGIIDGETMYLIEKCTMVKLLHRTELSKNLLVQNIAEKNESWWFYKEIEAISSRLGITQEEVINYPDRTRVKLEEQYYNSNEVELEIIETIKGYLSDFGWENKRKLIDLVKLVW